MKKFNVGDEVESLVDLQPVTKGEIGKVVRVMKYTFDYEVNFPSYTRCYVYEREIARVDDWKHRALVAEAKLEGLREALKILSED